MMRTLLFRHAIAGPCVQPHDYIIRAGTEIEVLSTGKADIYLRIGNLWGRAGSSLPQYP